MARKGNKKKQKKNKKVKKNYSQKEFCEVFCQTCLICQDVKSAKPAFCYNGLYRHEPKPFINKVFNNLIDIHAIYQTAGSSMKAMSVEQFQNVVCRTGICFDDDGYASADCDQRDTCYKDFMKQQGIPNPRLIMESDVADLIDFKNNKTTKLYTAYSKKKKGRKGKKRYVCTPYATFFSRDNTDFQVEIRRILYGDNDLEQDKDQELSASDTGAADRHTEGREPKV
jgi:hypothetical protein